MTHNEQRNGCVPRNEDSGITVNHSIRIPGRPQGKARARTVLRGGRVHSYTPANTTAYESLIRQCWTEQTNGIKLHGSVKAALTARYVIPKGFARAERARALRGDVHPQTKPDLDNVIKALLDALSGTAYDDDRQVVQIHAQKTYADNPCVELTLSEINGAEQLEP